MEKRKSIPKRTWISAGVIFILIPLTFYMAMNLSDRKYYFMSLMMIIYSMVPFFVIFEKRKPKARELLIIGVLSAIAVASRTAFIFIPFFKPLVAVVIIAGISFGGEAGFLCGAISGFVSNFIFGQGPWTPYQMFAFGMAGFIAGVIYRKGLLRKEKVSLSIFGALMILLVVGPLLDLSSLLTSVSVINWTTIRLYLISGFSINTIHALSTGLFLLVLSEPMFEKLDRVKLKYGIIEDRER